MKFAASFHSHRYLASAICVLALCVVFSTSSVAADIRIEVDSDGCDPTTAVCVTSSASSLPYADYATQSFYSVLASADVTASQVKFFADSNRSGFLYVSFFDTYTLTGPAALMGTQTTVTPTLHVTGTMAEGSFGSGFLGFGGLDATIGTWVPDAPPGGTLLEQFRVTPFATPTADQHAALPGTFSGSQIVVPVDLTASAPITVTYGVPFDVAYEVATGGSAHTIFDFSHTAKISFDGVADGSSLTSVLGYSQGTAPTNTVPEPDSLVLLTSGISLMMFNLRSRNRVRFLMLFVLLVSASIACLAQPDWTQRFPTTSPSRRFQPSMAQFNSYTLLFGGNSPSFPIDPPLDDTWLWDGLNWTQLTHFGIFGTSPHPPARSRAAMAYDPVNDQVVMFGGDGGRATTLGDTWVFKLSSNALLRRSFYSWGQPAVENSPPARIFGIMEYDPAIKKVVLTGGIDSSGAPLQDAWAFDPGVPTWTRINTPTVVSPHRRVTAMAKCGSTVVFFGLLRQISPTQILLFGGDNDLGDSWMLNNSNAGLNWSGPALPDPSPIGRGGHAMAYYPVANRVILYGGQNEHAAHLFDDTWNGLCGSSASWSQATPAHNPGRRAAMGMATGPDGMTVVMFGGLKEGLFNEQHENNETWTWGRRAACLPADNSEVRVGSKIKCQFDKVDGVNFGGWTASGIAPPFRDELKPIFHTESPGPATITAEWTDDSGYHTMTYHYDVVRPHH